MKVFRHSLQIEAPIETVWALLSDVAVWPRWLPTVSEVMPLGAGKVEVGARFVVRQPKLPPATWQVIAVNAPNSFAWEARSPGVRTHADHLLTPVGRESCAVELRFGFGGALGFLLAGLFASRTRAYLAQECEALKLAAERIPEPDDSSKALGI